MCRLYGIFIYSKSEPGLLSQFRKQSILNVTEDPFLGPQGGESKYFRNGEI